MGYFDRQQARKIEQEAYVSAIDQYLRQELPYEEEQDEPLDEESLENERKQKEIIERWRGEFIQRYGDEP
ncbi:MAG: hypothetical protein HYW62_02640 [Candidatus Levybacteria bacterium]|nr:hypothetical protein [Candidatus Levybacteria bacterium]